ncbi:MULTISPECIES: oligosaccharide flippase family protein [unclassified Actinomyces]|uniref:oligosaccharide flippase family protein n=1 Tax=unclassified Actinomyces TaxID=2609248 RepID=UPI0013A69F54|nr:oligosaccharide flippase family protein [Actinomyces sp. 594]MBW3069370.1 oligosaccharide flippase family protein [Actinomyces sp. 594]NDR53751.1 oligosaccharide flippase family protein [Actinomyces sp. 565]
MSIRSLLVKLRRPGIKSGTSTDSLLLASVKVVTLASAMVNTMILSHSLSLTAYGTYAQGVLLVAVCSDGTILGMVDAVNYFFNRGGRNASAREYVRTILGLQTVIGLVTAIVLVVARGAIGGYFSNPLLEPLIVLLALRPMLTNMMSMLQVLVVSIGRARAIAVRNLAFSALKLTAVLITALVTSSIAVLFVMLLALDLASVLWFWDCFRRWQYLLLPARPRWLLARDILAFALPMGVYVMTSSVMRQVGALVIGMYETTERYAVYANASTVLPLDVIPNSFLTVIIPIVTRYLGAGRKDLVRRLFHHYLAVGYLTTVTFCVATMVVAPEVIQVLYGARYLGGLAVFRLYLITTMVRFAGLSLILSAAGRTRTLMAVSLAAVAANIVACPAMYALLGFVGPAVASVGVNLAMTCVLLRLSLKEIDGGFASAFDARTLGRFALTAAAVALAGQGLRAVLHALGVPVLGIAVAVLCAVSAAILLLNRRSLATSLREINAMK